MSYDDQHSNAVETAGKAAIARRRSRPAMGRPAAVGPKRGSKKRRGVTMVEFAIVVPLLFFFFFSAFEFCRVAMIRHTVDNAVYEGCRTAIVPGATTTEARATANNILNTLGLRGATITVSPAQLTNQTPEFTMTVEVALDDNTFVPPQFTGGQRISRTLTMQRERSGL